jgi:plastocyanin
MIWRWVISSKKPGPFCVFVIVLWLMALIPLLSAGDVTGRVELVDSGDPGVRKHGDRSGVVISLIPMSGGEAKPAQPIRATITQKDKRFLPHILAVPVGSTVDFPNLDPIFHNAFSSYNGQLFDLGLYPPGSTRSVRFTRPGVVRVFCNIHSSMSAMIVVLATPWFAVTGRDGSIDIRDVPPGEYGLRLVHERATEATLQALSRRITVPKDTMSLGVLSISEAGHLSTSHKNKYGHDYPLDPDEHSAYPEIGK